VGSQFGPGFSRNPEAWTDTPALRTAIGKAAKAGDGWFKRQDHAQEWAGIICAYVEDASMANSDFVRQIGDLRGWIDRA
jgi:hypothetical protein